MLGYYNTVQEGKAKLMAYGFEISENIGGGEIVYLNKYGVKVTMRKYSDNTCRLW